MDYDQIYEPNQKALANPCNQLVTDCHKRKYLRKIDSFNKYH